MCFWQNFTDGKTDLGGQIISPELGCSWRPPRPASRRPRPPRRPAPRRPAPPPAHLLLWFRRLSGGGEGLAPFSRRCAARRSPCSCCCCSSCCCSSCSPWGKKIAAAPWPTTSPAPSCSCSATMAPRPPSPPGLTGDFLLQPSISPGLLLRTPGKRETGIGWMAELHQYKYCINVPSTKLLFIRCCLRLFILNVYYV